MIAQTHNIYLNTPPFSRAGRSSDNVVIEVYLPDKNIANGYAILAFPGGGYSFLSDKSGKDYGIWFAERGFSVFVLKFRLGSDGYDFRSMCTDAYAAYSYIYKNHSEFNIDQNKIGLIGTSAGAHLASVMATSAGRELLKKHGVSKYVDLNIEPNFCVLCYGVLSLLGPIAHAETRDNFLAAWRNDFTYQESFSPINWVSSHTPKTFLWHTAEDDEVTVENTLIYAKELRKINVPYELHVYQKGGHALGLALDKGLHWANDCARWIVDS